MLINELYSDIQTPTGTLRLHKFMPNISLSNNSFPTILVFTEIYQVTGPVERFCRQIASEGYLVVCPESYHEFLPEGTVLTYDTEGTDLGNKLKITKELGSYDSDVTAILDYLQTLDECNGRFGATGMCLGGHLALRASFDPRISACVSYFPTDIHSSTLGSSTGASKFGTIKPTIERFTELKGNTELLMIFGKQDNHIPQQGRTKIYEKLVDCGVVFSWCEFQAQHAFIRDESSKGRYDFALASGCFGLFKEMMFRRVYLGQIFEGEQKIENVC